MQVSVMMVTYNHEKYIGQAIEGVVMQETDFPYELVIGEDCSTDSTREIVIDYAHRYPDKIRLLLPERNLGVGENVRRTREACQGKYTAVCEGDDYWTDPHKLQKQVDFLEAHPSSVLCFHSVAIVDEDEREDPWVFPELTHPVTSRFEDLLKQNFIPTCSILRRTGMLAEFPEWLNELPMGDWPSHLLHAHNGDIGYIAEVMAVYRTHAGGTWTGSQRVHRLRGDIDMWESINNHFGAQYDDLIGELVADHWGGIAALSLAEAAASDRNQVIPSEVIKQFQRWSRASTLSDVWQDRSRAKIYAGLLFAAYEAQAFDIVRRYWWQTLRSDRAWWRNRGVWSIGVEAFLGQRVARLLRQLAHSA